MALTGIIAEFDPFHGGHAHLIAEAKRMIPGTGIACVMSGGFTQRGAPACGDRIARARAAVENGADIVFELPVAAALSPAPLFARGGVAHLAATGLLTHLAFGSECGDIAALRSAAGAEADPDFSRRVKELISSGLTYAAAAARASGSAVLENPNDVLAVEYIRAMNSICPGVEPVAVKRIGAAHGSSVADGLPSASYIRTLARQGASPEDLPLPQNVREILSAEAALGRFPLDPSRLDAAVLGVICRMSREELALVPEGGEGLGGRIWEFASEARSVEELCAKAKSRNFTLARVRRCVWQAFLGITREDQLAPPRYLRVLAVGKGGRELLRQMEATAKVPVVTKPAVINSDPLAQLEARAENLRSIALDTRENYFAKSPYVVK